MSRKIRSARRPTTAVIAAIDELIEDGIQGAEPKRRATSPRSVRDGLESPAH